MSVLSGKELVVNEFSCLRVMTGKDSSVRAKIESIVMQGRRIPVH